VLAALLIAAVIVPGTVGGRDRGIVLLDAALHLLEHVGLEADRAG
jgi:hypothetical protein